MEVVLGDVGEALAVALEEVDPAAPDGTQAARIGVDAQHPRPGRHEAERGGEPDVPQPHDRHGRRSRLGGIAAVGSRKEGGFSHEGHDGSCSKGADSF